MRRSRAAISSCLVAALAAFCPAQNRPANKPVEPAPPVAQKAPDTKPPADSPEERLAREGNVEALEGRFLGIPSTDQLRLLAVAQTNKAARTRNADDRQKAFAAAEQRYRKWIDAVGKDPVLEEAQRLVGQTEARSALAGMMLAQWAGPDLDELEITDGASGDRDRVRKVLEAARNEFELSRKTLAPLQKQLEDGGYEAEERLLALGVFESIRRLQLDAEFSLGWTHIYLAMVLPPGEPRDLALHAAETKFNSLIEGGAVGVTIYRCQLGLGIALRELGRLAESDRALAAAAEPGVEPALEAQVRYETARLRIKQAKFDEARDVLRPLLESDPEKLPDALRAARLHVNLAHLWEANSYLLESESLLKTADPVARQAARIRTSRARETGLVLLNRLSQRGGPWPAIVQPFALRAIDLKADLRTLSPLELLFSARALADARQFDDALARLQEATRREDASKDTQAEIWNEFGLIAYRHDELRRAAEAFSRVASDYRSNPLARTAVTYAYQLWAKLAEDSKQQADYARLADTLLVLLESFPEHEKREEAMWWLPVALQAGGRYAAAAEQFAKIPENAPHWEEAQLRRLLCQRQEWDAQRGGISPAEALTRGRRIAEELQRYSEQAFARGAKERRTRVLECAASAAIESAEIWATEGLDRFESSLQTLQNFESRFSDSTQAGRVLAARIRAYRGLRQFEQASAVVDEYLKTVPVEKAGSILLALARGMQDEVDRLEQKGDHEALRKLAGESVGTFEQLERWVTADPRRASGATAVKLGLARMLYLAGRLDDARRQSDSLLEADSRNGAAIRLLALISTESLGDSPTPDAISAAKQRWEAMLRDPGIRTAAPQRYWEARYYWLTLTLREGRSADVAAAIRQDSVWNPELGGPPWGDKLRELAAKAGATLPSASAPSTSSAPAKGETE
ncbi:MAG: hypothetical protein U1D55_17090 [Phycisphaerae bacterium]